MLTMLMCTVITFECSFDYLMTMVIFLPLEDAAIWELSWFAVLSFPGRSAGQHVSGSAIQTYWQGKLFALWFMTVTSVSWKNENVMMLWFYLQHVWHINITFHCMLGAWVLQEWSMFDVTVVWVLVWTCIVTKAWY